MIVKGSNFDARQMRLSRAYLRELHGDGSEAHLRLLRLAYWRMMDHRHSLRRKV
jgi:hypothetical protein